MAQGVPSAGVQSWERFIAGIDRRLIYGGLFLFTLLPLVFNLALPVYVTPPVRGFAEAIDKLPADKFVFVSANWDAGTYAESEPQTIAIFRHLLRRKLKFLIFSVGYPNSPQLTQNALNTAIALELPNRAETDYPVYGVDYVNAGYKVRNAPWVRSLVRDPASALKADWKGKDVKSLPMFQSLKSMPGQVSMLIDITGSATTPMWISLVRPEGIEISLACTAVMAPEQYPYLATGQLMGMLTGMRGAAEYEKLIGFEGRATRMMGGQSFAHLYMFLLIGLGNVAVIRGMLVRARRT